MDWNAYEKFLDQKIADAQYNLEHAAKTYMEAKAKYEAMIREKETFLRTVGKSLNQIVS